MPSRDGIGLDDDKTTRPQRPRLAERRPEGSIDVLERWSRALLLQRRHLLSSLPVVPDAGLTAAGPRSSVPGIPNGLGEILPAN